ncbi:hypothetical protein FRC14_006375 [Serendipita sp. 396]|nr:hypothetical protein FRC14_006375 [Serendipita sp. 396]KAG8863692.1 hypothetical protein FRC20_010562 [Serendipita sp. 405]
MSSDDKQKSTQLKQQDLTTASPALVPPKKKKKEPYPFWLGGVAASIAASITQYVHMLVAHQGGALEG